VEAGAKVYFVYNNPDDVLRRHVTRSREVIEDERIEKINLTTGPMAITGSTRMQATTIQLCVLLTVLEMALRELMSELEPNGPCALPAKDVPAAFLDRLSGMHASLKSPGVLQALASIVALEESVYRAGKKNNYFASRFGIDVLTDTTERSPTYCTPPFRKFDDLQATESWAFLFVPESDTGKAWQSVIKRRPRCVEWTQEEVTGLVGAERATRTIETVRRISYAELMRFKVGLDGLPFRKLGPGDCAVGVMSEAEKQSLLSSNGFHRVQLEAARKAGARLGLICLGGESVLKEISSFLSGWSPECTPALIQTPKTDFLLDGVTRVGLKMALNALSTCTMVRLGRVMGNYMIWVVPSNLKLIDRSTRYIQRLTGLDYRPANELLFEVIEYVEPRMKADQAYPPVVGVSVMRQRFGLDNLHAEQRLYAELGNGSALA
jgi:N-acetylmuramic acid 6-phosphate etherase